MNGVNLDRKLATFSEHFKPRTVGQFNGHDLMVVKVKGPFVWHRHEETDDFFLVLKGRIRIELRDGSVELGPGELFVVPKGVEHGRLPTRRPTSSSSSPRGPRTPATPGLQPPASSSDRSSHPARIRLPELLVLLELEPHR